MSLSFEEKVNGIEDGIVSLLQAEMTGVKKVEVYANELDFDGLSEREQKERINALRESFPLVLAGYTDGEDKQDAPTGKHSVGLNKFKALHFRHDCSFAVFCLTSNPRGLKARKRGVGNSEIGIIEMISQVREILTGVQFSKTVGSEKLILNEGLLEPKGNEYIARLTGITVYAVIFQTYFRWSSRDRRTAGIDVDEIILDVEPLNQPRIPENNLPGVAIG